MVLFKETLGHEVLHVLGNGYPRLALVDDSQSLKEQTASCVVAEFIEKTLVLTSYGNVLARKPVGNQIYRVLVRLGIHLADIPKVLVLGHPVDCRICLACVLVYLTVGNQLIVDANSVQCFLKSTDAREQRKESYALCLGCFLKRIPKSEVKQIHALFSQVSLV